MLWGPYAFQARETVSGTHEYREEATAEAQGRKLLAWGEAAAELGHAG